MIKMSDIEEYDEILNEVGEDISQILPKKKDLIDPTSFVYDSKKEASPLGGSMPKLFIRCDSRNFRDLIKELKKPNCSYVTYINDLVHSLTEDGVEKFPLSKISVMVKKTHKPESWQMEEKASRIANELEVPTVFNQTAYIAGHLYTLSVDFLSKDEEYISLEHLESMDDVSFISMNRMFANHLGYYIDNEHFTKEKVKELCADLMEQYVFKKYILNDHDFNFNNVGLIHNKKTNTYFLAPCFDMEYSSAGLPNKDSLYVDIVSMTRANKEKLEEIINKYRQKLSNVKTRNKLDKEILQRMQIVVDTYDLVMNGTRHYI